MKSRLVTFALLCALCANLQAAEAPRPRLQIINGSEQPIDIFWLKSATERVPNGSVAPGKDTIITTTLGHRFALVGRTDKSEATVASTVRVQAFRFGGVPAFYTQRITANGYPIVASAKVNPYALKEAAYLVDLLLAKRPDVRDAMVKSGSRLCVIAWNEFTTDQPEFARLAEGRQTDHPALSGREFWDARARGLGGSETDPFCSCAEENLLCYPGDPYSAENILIHEFAHNIHLRGIGVERMKRERGRGEWLAGGRKVFRASCFRELKRDSIPGKAAWRVRGNAANRLDGELARKNWINASDA